MMMKIAVFSMPRCGQVWLTRLIADTLDCRVETWLPQDEGRDIATIGHEHRPADKFTVTRGHTFRETEQYAPDAIIHLIRDPRDVTASTGRYRYPELAEDVAIQMATAANEVTASWDSYARMALNQYDLGCEGAKAVMLTYEALRRSTEGALDATLKALGIVPDYARLCAAVENQSFDNTKRWVNAMPADFLGGTSKRHLGFGQVNGWRKTLPSNLGDIVLKKCDPELLAQLGYA